MYNQGEKLAFQHKLGGARRVLVLTGAGLSLPSGFPGLRTVCPGAMDIVTREAWDTDPGAVWQYYTARRRQCTLSKPNKAHFSLARLHNLLGDRMLLVSHTVDDLFQKAGYPKEDTLLMLGLIYDVKCTHFRCTYAAEDRSDPLVPALAPSKFNDPFDLAVEELPKCPKCRRLLRPNCVWFGDPMSQAHLKRIDEFIHQVDLVLIVGMSGTVWPTAGYVKEVQARGGQVAVFNIDEAARGSADYFFEGDVQVTVPEVLGM